MKQAVRLAAPILVLLSFSALAACEDSTSGETPTPDAGPIDIDAGGGQDGGDPPVPSKCPAPTAPPVEHKTQINADETWGAGYHDVTFDISIRNATVTIEPCAIVRVVPSRGIQVGFSGSTPGKIIAKGTADLPIVFEAKEPGKKWGGILINPAATADLAYVTIKEGGDVASSRGGGALHLLGDQTKPIQYLATADHVTFENSPKYGVIVEAHAAFTAESRDLVIKGSGDAAMRIPLFSASTLPTGSYTGNTLDAIRLMGSSNIDYVTDGDVTLHDRGVPYVVGGDGAFPELSVNSTTVGTAPLLTIEAGVTLKFAKHDSSGIFVERASTTNPARGALQILGTAQKPVVLTSNEAAPAAGDWVGIFMRGLPDPRNKIDFARIEYAGHDTGTSGFSCGTPASPNPGSNEAAIAIFGQPNSAFVTNTTILKSGANAIERAWTGTPVDFLPTNTFTDNTYCRQTFPRPASPGTCPDPAPCD